MKWKSQAGGGAPTFFSDPLINTGGSALGFNWMPGYADITQASFFNPTLARTATGLQLQNNTGGGASISMVIAPLLTFPGVVGLTQFSQCTFVSNIGAFPSAGPAVAVTADSLTTASNGYFANVQPPNNFLQIRVSNFGQRLVQNNIGTTVAAGAVIRLSIQFGATANTLIVSINGVSQGTFTDNDATRPVAPTGFPCLFWKGCAAGSSIFFSNFSCGLGL
jgi:hypothetical protein